MPLALASTVSGQGQPAVILHGLFGSGWRVRSPIQSRCAELAYQSPVVESMRVSACS